MQLLEVGVTSREIWRRISVGRLHPVHRGVYAVGHPALAPLARELAALLACGPAAALSHASAAAVWGLLPAQDGPVHVTSTGTHRIGPAGVVVHRAQHLPPHTLRDDLRLTSAARTLQDLAATASAPTLEAAVNEAHARRLVHPEALRAALEPGRRGSVALRGLLGGGPRLTRSQAERGLLALVARAGLPRPQTNVRIGRHEVDALWPVERVIVEVDGYAFHASRTAFEQDRLRDADLHAAGHRVLRFTWRQLTSDPEVVVARLATVLALTARAA